MDTFRFLTSVSGVFFKVSINLVVVLSCELDVVGFGNNGTDHFYFKRLVVVVVVVEGLLCLV